VFFYEQINNIIGGY